MNNITIATLCILLIIATFSVVYLFIKTWVRRVKIIDKKLDFSSITEQILDEETWRKFEVILVNNKVDTILNEGIDIWKQKK